jgi:ParB-like chromosome segregation protein Spo0J
MKILKAKCSDLHLDPNNAREHDDRNVKSIKESLSRFGQQKPIVVDGNNVVVAGNGQLLAAIELGWNEIEIHKTELEGNEAVAYAVADNRTAELATWNDVQLSETLAMLRDDVSIDERVTGFNQDEVADIAGSLEEESKYTRKIDLPTYEPRNVDPEIDELYDCEKTNTLEEEIKEAELDPELEKFLLAAASRHIVFNFSKIADKYAHASKEVQNLMERSALVIIDFNKAIENGFVSLSEKMSAIFSEDQKDA